MTAAVEAALDALTALGSAIRGDWSEFDGRTLRDQIGSWRGLYERADRGELSTTEAHDWLRAWGVCPVDQCWREHCDSREEHFGAFA